ncbi:hypothetical protein Jab_1c07200 [Janthinobacterium sp. HH01]|uniref:PEP-CTERM sorting domain-containing protein n=1 Tax=Janthinobacterium sp. HH01 TaxID=1198452 RepID=UPI0002AEB232|nr:PEP-CTERM sorting domain-containing protein [Janthinobacterium sp. HH01]ELX12127.1 hypothetical protein Jab_1c07200 [Janthinobacterium sp. HH01]
MKYPSSLTRILLGAATLLTGLSAHAGGSATATASWSNLTLGVIDLTPADGNAASYALNFSNVSFTDVVDGEQAGGNYQYVNTYVPRDQPMSKVVQYQGASASSSTNGTPGNLYSQTYLPSTSGYVSLAIRDNNFLYLDLAPHSALTLSGHVETSITFAGDSSPYGYDASASAALSIRLWDDRDFPTYLSQNSRVTWQWGSAPNLSRDYTVTYKNTSDTTQSVVVNYATFVESSLLPSVPEPGSYAMLGVGLALLGAVARRRKASQS